MDNNRQRPGPMAEGLMALFVSCALIFMSLSAANIASNSTPDIPNFFAFVTLFQGKHINKFWFLYAAVIFQVFILFWVTIGYLYTSIRGRVKRKPLITLVIIELVCGIGCYGQASQAMLAAGCDPPSLTRVMENALNWDISCELPVRK